MRRFKIFLASLLILGHGFTEVGPWLQRYFKPRIIYVKPWISNTYDFPEYPGTPKDSISLYWWVTYNSTEILYCILFAVMAWIARLYSFQLFLVACVFFLYHCFDYFMLWYNFKSLGWAYRISHAAVLISIIMLFIPEKRKGIVKSLK